MKPAKLRREDNFVDEILEALRFVPKSRLRIVRDVVGALAEAAVREKDGKRLKRAGRKSLLKTHSVEFGKEGATSATAGPTQGA